jgi:hypothetical protein
VRGILHDVVPNRGRITVSATSCIDCGKQIGNEATFCSFCGARQKEHPSEARFSSQTVPNTESLKPARGRPGSTKKVIGLGLIAFAVLIILAVIGSNSNDTNKSASSTNDSPNNDSGTTKGEGSKSAFIGNRAIAELGPVIGCPDWKDYKQVVKDIVAHDDVGKVDDFTQGGCTLIKKGDTGLIIDAGFASIRVRLDKDETAYWTGSMFGDPARPLFVCSGGGKCGP